MARMIDGEKMNLVGKQVRRFRVEQKMSRQQLSAKPKTLAVYICRGSVSGIEDQTRTVSDIELWGLAKIPEKPIQSFFEDVDC